MDNPGKYKIVLDSDDAYFGGCNRLDHNVEFFTVPDGFAGRRNSAMVNQSAGQSYSFKSVSLARG